MDFDKANTYEKVFSFLTENFLYELMRETLREMEEAKPPIRGEILFREENILYVNFDSQRP